jgi:hypothetical protein
MLDSNLAILSNKCQEDLFILSPVLNNVSLRGKDTTHKNVVSELVAKAKGYSGLLSLILELFINQTLLDNFCYLFDSTN